MYLRNLTKRSCTKHSDGLDRTCRGRSRRQRPLGPASRCQRGHTWRRVPATAAAAVASAVLRPDDSKLPFSEAVRTTDKCGMQMIAKEYVKNAKKSKSTTLTHCELPAPLTPGCERMRCIQRQPRPPQCGINPSSGSGAWRQQKGVGGAVIGVRRSMVEGFESQQQILRSTRAVHLQILRRTLAAAARLAADPPRPALNPAVGGRATLEMGVRDVCSCLMSADPAKTAS